MNIIEKKIKKIISEQLDIKESKIHKYSSLVEDLNADSLDSIELIMRLEEEFKIDISDDAAEEFDTVKNIIEYIKKILNVN